MAGNDAAQTTLLVVCSGNFEKVVEPARVERRLYLSETRRTASRLQPMSQKVAVS